MSLGQKIIQHCASKTRFESRALAEAEMRDQKHNGALKPEHRVYKCTFCDGWHIGRRKRK